MFFGGCGGVWERNSKTQKRNRRTPKTPKKKIGGRIGRIGGVVIPHREGTLAIGGCAPSRPWLL